MPEQLTKHPEATLTVLRSAGAQCGSGDAPEILKSCPPGRFCKLPGGEICVYGLADADQMTQISSMDWRALQFQQGNIVTALHTVPLGTFIAAVAAAVVVGMLLSAWLGKVRRRRQLRKRRREKAS